MTSKDLRFFPGCALEGTGAEYGRSTLAVLKALDSPVRVLNDWNCCGASAARSEDPALAVRLSARNLVLAAREGCDVLVTCAACYNNLAYSRHYLKEHPEAWPASRSSGEARPESAAVFHLLELMTSEKMLARLSERLAQSLAGMRLACYYGCLLVRPGGYTNVDDAENPHLMDDLMRLCGAETIDWSYKTDCCGGSASLTQGAVALELMARIFDSCLEQDVTALVTACPLCHMNLDAWQKKAGEALGREIRLPVYYFTELLGLAMGLPDVAKWFKGHLTHAGIPLRKCR
jgi:heterodisulfide reductase subunit B